MKKIISVIIVVAMLLSCSLCFSVSASDTNSLAKNKLNKLVESHDGVYLWLGEPRAYSIYDSYGFYLEAKDVLNNKSSTDEDYTNILNKLIYADLNEIYIEPYIAKATCENALKEQNYNNWYTDEDWQEFQDKLADLKAEVDKLKSYVDYSKELTDAFHALLKAYNEMTNKYTLKGDVNRDGKVNILDVTLLQRNIAQLEKLTGAQKMLTGKMYYNEDVTISDVTEIQKYIAQLINKLPGKDVFIDDLNLQGVDRDLLMERTFNFNICPRIFNETGIGVYMNNAYSGIDVLYGYYIWCGENNVEP